MISNRCLIFIILIGNASLFNAQNITGSASAESKAGISIDNKVLGMLCGKEWFVTKTLDKINSYEHVGTRALACGFRFTTDGEFAFCKFKSKWKNKEKFISIEVPGDSVGENYDALLLKGEWLIDSIADNYMILAKQFSSDNKRQRMIYFSSKKYEEKKFYVTAKNFLVLPASLVYAIYDKDGKAALRGENDSININKLKAGSYLLNAGDWSGDFIKK